MVAEAFYLKTQTTIPGMRLRFAGPDDVPLILDFIRGLAEYERLARACTASVESLRETLFGSRRYAEVILGYQDETPIAFALFFHNYSTFLAKPGIYLEDLFVKPEWRGRGYGRAILAQLARLAIERGCGRMEWAVLDWNEDAIRFYERLGATALDDWTTFRVTDGPLQRLASESQSHML
jgi:GNAT superfamily N-acetyltransferase